MHCASVLQFVQQSTAVEKPAWLLPLAMYTATAAHSNKDRYKTSQRCVVSDMFRVAGRCLGFSQGFVFQYSASLHAFSCLIQHLAPQHCWFLCPCVRSEAIVVVACSGMHVQLALANRVAGGAATCGAELHCWFSFVLVALPDLTWGLKQDCLHAAAYMTACTAHCNECCGPHRLWGQSGCFCAEDDMPHMHTTCC